MKRDAKDSLACIPWYWRDWRASTARAVLMRDPVAALAYRELLDAMWGEPDGKLPDDDAVLVSLSGLTNRAWVRVRTKVLAFLPVGEDGKRTHPRTQHEIQKALTYRERCRVGGLKTAAQRWGSSSPPIAQLPVGNRTPSPTPSPSPSPSQEQTLETQKGTESGEPSKGSPQVVPLDLAGLDLYLADRRLCEAWEDFRRSQEIACPGIDLLAETRKAHAWETANPTQRKKNRTRFLSSWFSRAQDRIGRPQSGPRSSVSMFAEVAAKFAAEDRAAETGGLLNG